MKILLIAINAKYIHSNPAVYSLSAYAGERLAPYIEIAEYTINNKKEEILADIFRRNPDVAAFSCYIWNWSLISSILTELPKIMPGVHIWLGGPEVSYDPNELLKKNPMVTGIMLGEGEETFKELAEHYCSKANLGIEGKSLDKISGIVYYARSYTQTYIPSQSESVYIESEAVLSQPQKDACDEICHTSMREPMDISRLPFLYDNLYSFENRIIYYETSRGCPYRCSYCLSSIDKTVRLRDMDTVKKELQFFLDNKVKQVKFVDRTFNCNHAHACEIWEYLSENDNGVTNFHFEIAAEIISKEELEILARLRPGLAQLEIGVQTINQDTLKEIRRTSDIDRLRSVVERIIGNGNIHVHLDLIAGLPFEDYESFINSFNVVYAMKPHQLQLGFLKVLKGSYMHEKADDYGIQYTDDPPYEVLSTKWLPYEKLRILKQVEEMVELYYNSNQFTHTMPVLQSVFPNAYTLYRELAGFYQEKGYSLMTPARVYRYQILLDFAMNTALSEESEMIRQVLTFDLYLRENIKSRPDFANDLTPYKNLIKDFYKKEEENRHFLPDYSTYDHTQLSRLTHIEFFNYPVWETDAALQMQRLDTPMMVLFDYQNRNPLTYEAQYIVVDT
ncbi:MAG: B12-binding domain-containing radical SAM protein [Lachnospiraceae bacterium]|nr:B12-binding domain-containing radical SAM protein [Lachnospiraceae bacterium]